MTTDKLHTVLSRVSKPAQYLGNEINVIKKDFDAAEVRVCLVFPDKYEMGMSHNGLKILYEVLNRLPHVVCERAYAPELDMEAALREEGIPLFSLESKRPLKDFDIVGFSFTYELTYTNFLNMLDLGGIPLWQKDRTNAHPLILGGGGSMMNAEPIADFLDAAVLGDGEEVILEIVETVRNNKKNRAQLLDQLSGIEGVYIPSFFQPIYNEDLTLQETKPLKVGYTRVNKRVVQNIDKAVYPTKLLVPAVKLIHDRIGIEIQRGCNRACRFCQAGYIDRPVRQRSPEKVLQIAEDSLAQTGIEEISLLSLSAADYATLVPLLAEMNRRYSNRKVSISVPATRTEKLTPELIEQIKKVRKTGFTVAPEAGSPRMRRVINKGNQVDDLYRAVTNAFSAGWDLLKLYYMVGLPFELDEDVVGIANEGNASIEICNKYSRRAELNLSVSSFIPKPHTPFQWEPQMSVEETRRKHMLVKTSLKNRRIRFKNHRPEMSYLEGILSRGDRRVARLLHAAFTKGCRFDEWEEHFDFSKWQTALEEWDMDAAFYLHRRRSFSETLPWDHLFGQMDKNWLWDEYQKAREVALDGLKAEQRSLLECDHTFQEYRRLKPLEGQLAGFTEDCSINRCSYCGVCDFKVVKNRIFVVGDQEIMVKKGNREWYGWRGADRGSQFVDRSSLSYDPRSATHDPQPTLRFRFSKTGDARYLGHLELMGVLKRAILRLGLPVKYSEGFHPQMKLAMGYPLPLGIESQWEFFDLELKQLTPPLEELVAALNPLLPGGLLILSAEFIDRSAPSLYSSLASVTYRAVFDKKLPGYHSYIQKFEDSTEFIWERNGERGVKKFNLKNLVKVVPEEEGLGLTFQTQVEPEGTLKPQEVLSALLGIKKAEMGDYRLTKTAVNWRNTQRV